MFYLVGRNGFGVELVYAWCETEGIPACVGHEDTFVELFNNSSLPRSGADIREMYYNISYWDTSINRIVMFRGYDEDDDNWASRAWTMDPTAGTPSWTNLNATNMPLNNISNSTTDLTWTQVRPGLYHLHQVSHQNATFGEQVDYLYDLSTNNVTVLPDTGDGPQRFAYCTHDAALGTIGGTVCHEFTGVGQTMILWAGTFVPEEAPELPSSRTRMRFRIRR